MNAKWRKARNDQTMGASQLPQAISRLISTGGLSHRLHELRPVATTTSTSRKRHIFKHPQQNSLQKTAISLSM